MQIGNQKNPFITGIPDYFLDIAKWKISWHKFYVIPWQKYSISTTVQDDLTEIPWLTTVIYPNGVTLEILSSSASDTAAGTGARTIDIHYLDSSNLEKELTITLNWTTPVSLWITANRIQWMHTKTAGSGWVCVWNITIRSIVTPANIYEYILAGWNQSLSGRYTVPAGKTGYIVWWDTSAINKRMSVKLRATVERYDRSLQSWIFTFQDNALLNNSAVSIPFYVPLKCPETTDIKLSALADAVWWDCGWNIHILLVDN